MSAFTQSFASACTPCALANASAAACLLTITGNVDYGVNDNVGRDGD
jgi:hypothetical protein